MNCKKARELILTDYLDDQMDAGRKLLLERHLDRCAGCREALAAARKVTDGLFAGARQLKPADFLWQQVKKTIIAQDNRKINFAAGFLDRLRSAAYVRKPVFAVACLIMLVLVVGTTLTLKINGRAAAEESGYRLIDDETDFGTPVEQYFL